MKYVGEEHTDHLLKVLRKPYDVSADWQGCKYAGINLDWDYDLRKVQRPSLATAERHWSDLDTVWGRKDINPTLIHHQSMVNQSSMNRSKTPLRN